ncbi:MAG: hypothetical protein GSR85_07795 [Desulfurococcales archaeon]|nr:hypothetical protein [Desulfurococcales archaeon]
MNSILMANKIKRHVIEAIRIFRGLPILPPADVKIEILERKDKNYIIRGNYKYSGILGNIIEEGEFEVELDNNLNLVTVKITPRKH